MLNPQPKHILPRSENKAVPESKPEKAPTDNPYVFDDVEKALWGRGGAGSDMSSPIARAWSRVVKHGHYVGHPIGPEWHDDDTGYTCQDFQFAHACWLTRDNVNDTVSFQDARGVFERESGL